jgi:hypothetical protein
VDPSSPYSAGSILGDRIRMHDLSSEFGVLIRSIAGRGALGRLYRAADDSADDRFAPGAKPPVQTETVRQRFQTPDRGEIERSFAAR